mgnify:CR=1 FL=1
MKNIVLNMGSNQKSSDPKFGAMLLSYCCSVKNATVICEGDTVADFSAFKILKFSRTTSDDDIFSLNGNNE